MAENDPDDALIEYAFIATQDANCLYKPAVDAAISMTPPFGSKVDVIRQDGAWVLIRFFGKAAWCVRDNLSVNPEPVREPVTVGCMPIRSGNYSAYPSYEPNPLFIEYGPRGGRFVRTASGFRRYL